MKLFALALYLLPLSVLAGYSQTLPKGVRNLTFRLIKTNTIKGSYNAQGQPEGYSINSKINADVLIGLNGSVDTYLNGLSPADYNDFNFGTFEGNATSDVFAQALGAGYGITDKITVYGFIPFYDATVDLNLERTEKGRKNVGSSIALEGLPEIDVRIIQNLFVNYYKYKPLGKWEATGFGDFEFGVMWNFYQEDDLGLLVNFGGVAPTGREDSPDILQDISFGDGQWDNFIEVGGDYKLTDDLSLDAWTRYTLQYKFKKNVRQPENKDFPMTEKKGISEIDLGDKILLGTQINYSIDDQWSPSLNYIFEYKAKDNYSSNSPTADAINESNTELRSHTVRLGISYSTLELFKQKKFILPGAINFAIQSVLGGKNTPKYERADLEFRLFF
tara:strand:+ start:43778 stop:44944 length:1167 start_codon:yes stop_codon:yes gene_type:complete